MVISSKPLNRGFQTQSAQVCWLKREVEESCLHNRSQEGREKRKGPNVPFKETYLIM